jgi:hypothetical protein
MRQYPATMTREELVALTERWFAALPGGDAGVLPLAERVRCTENGVHVVLGRSGLWAATTAVRSPTAVHVADPAAGQVVSWALVEEDGPTIAGLRLGVADGLITEVEMLACRPRRQAEGGLLHVPGLMTTRPVFGELVPEAQRSTRDELIAAAHGYLDAIIACDSSLVHVRDDCRRIENGVLTVLNDGGEDLPAGRRDQPYWRMSVAEQVDSGTFRDIEAARDRRVLAIDEDRGLVALAFRFDHPGPTPGSDAPSRYAEPNGMVIMEVWKVVAGEIVHVESVLDVFEYGRSLGWP